LVGKALTSHPVIGANVSEASGRFAGKVLFATGAASGIAEQVALQFTAQGGRVAVVDLTTERAEAAAAKTDGAIGLGADVADEASVKAAIEATVERLGRIDCVLNAAGYADFGPLEDYSYERWQRMLNVHAGGTFLVCKHALPALRVDGGAIVNIASTAAIVAQPDNFAYGAAKAAIVGFSRQIALDLAPDGIRVNTVAPGRARSGITTPLYESRGGGSFEEGARISSVGVMQKRIAEPDEIASVITFLLSPEASFVTGALYVADGGETSA
jgi:NAD(P)-dependent dehydrogenase (short-subunit alcohol dehydrogenase family)